MGGVSKILRIEPGPASRHPIFRLHLFCQQANSRIVVLQVLLESLPTLARNDPLPRHTSFEIATSLLIGKLLGAELGTISADMTSVTATGKPLVRSLAAADPAIVAGAFLFLVS